MTKRMMLAFDHVPTGLNNAGGNVGAYSDFPFTYAPSGGLSATTGGAMSDSDGVWLASSAYYYNTQTSIGQWTLPISTYIDVTKPRSWFGFRFKWSGSWIGQPFGVTVNGNGGVALLTQADYSWASGRNYYIEVMIDRVNQTRSVWIDGALVVNASSVSLAGQVSTDKLIYSFASSITGNTGCTFQYKDMYFMDDPNDGSVSRLGPIVARPITINTASGTGWTPSSGSISGALNTTVNTGTPSTPNVTSASDGTPLVTTLATTADAGAAVQGLLFVASGERNSGTGTTLRTTIADQATPPNQLALTALQFSTTAFQYGRTLGFVPYAPDGSTWNAAKITALAMSAVASAT